MNSVNIRLAKFNEMEWVNARYEDIQFKKSDFVNEIIIIAECENEKCGLGRLIMLDDKNLELGGLYAFQQAQKKEIIKKMMSFLAYEKLCKQDIMWCLIAQEKKEFYFDYGFKIYNKLLKKIPIPSEIIKKIKWYKNTYNINAELLIKVD